MKELLNKYVEMFGENFPLYMCLGMPEKDIKAAINKALETGKPFKTEMRGDVVY